MEFRYIKNVTNEQGASYLRCIFNRIPVFTWNLLIWNNLSFTFGENFSDTQSQTCVYFFLISVHLMCLEMAIQLVTINKTVAFIIRYCFVCTLRSLSPIEIYFLKERKLLNTTVLTFDLYIVTE